MTSGQKIAFSILISMFLSVAFVVVGNLGLFSTLETRYYSKMKITEQKEHIDKIADGYNSYISKLLNEINVDEQSYLKSSSIESFFAQNPSEIDVNERKKLTEQLFSNFSCLSGIRVLDRNSRNVHYSSFDKTDVLRQVGVSKIYKNYPDILKDTDELEASLIMSDAINPVDKIILDEKRNRIVISVPYFSEDDILISSFVFYLDISLLNQDLFVEDVLTSGENPVMLKENETLGGFVLGLPQDRRNEFTVPIINLWTQISEGGSQNLLEPVEILQGDDFSYVTISSVNCPYFYFSGIYKNTLFTLSKDIVVMIYVCFGLTSFLIIFLLFSLKKNYLLTMKSRIKKIQYGIIDEYLENKEAIEWEKIAKQIDNRKKDLTDEIKKSIGRRSKKYSKEIDQYLEQSWADIIGIISNHYNMNKTQQQNSLSIEEIRNVIEDVLKNAKFNVNVSPTVVQTPSPTKKASAHAPVLNPEPVDEIEEVEEVADAESVDEIEEVEEVADAEPVDEIEEVEEVADAEPVDEIEEVEEVADAEPVDEIEEVEEVADAEPVKNPEDDPALFALMSPRNSQKHSVKDGQTYTQNVEGEDDFATVEDYQSEELCFGDIYTLQTENDSIILARNIEEPVEETEEVAAVEPVEEAEEVEEVADTEPVDEIEEVEELTAEEQLIPIEDGRFSMINFGVNMKDIVELEEEDRESIVQKDGLYSVAENIKYSDFTVDTNFKELVDSVIK